MPCRSCISASFGRQESARHSTGVQVAGISAAVPLVRYTAAAETGPLAARVSVDIGWNGM
jgi:EamA domain-containing membrane protein RarD